jgi:redox-sensitive bicupin YhaK (pirin superfamily)
MSVTERHPLVVEADSGLVATAELLLPREVPLGGPRAMLVQRTLPQRRRSLIGAWCFIDHYGPSEVRDRPMAVPGHPHTGLATVTWLFEGEVEHRDTSGVQAIVRPGEMNLMIAGRGVAHSEYSTPATTRLHGAQLWLALPDGARHGERVFAHYVPPVLQVGAATVRVFLGEWLGQTDGPATPTRLFGAEVELPARTTWTAPMDPAEETGILVDRGSIVVDGVAAERSQLIALPTGRHELVIETGAAPVRLLVLGGEPFPDPVVMWWNFVGRDHDEIVEARADWQRQVEMERSTGGADGRFGRHPDAWEDVLAAPELPTVRLKPRH